MALINRARLKQYLDLNYNVLFIGEHGIGKTMVIKELFEAEKVRYRYFSASTLDPWVDFVGVPKVVESGGVSRLELVRPAFIQNDEVDFLMFDELNRAPSKIINAIMELLQFKSINGHKLKNLRAVWAAINPEDDADTYAVNHLDPAHLDRFHVHLKVPFKVDEGYFKAKYPEHAGIFIEWWGDLPLDIKKMVSPRRLDYTIHAHLNGCRLEDFIPPEANPKKLRDALQSVPFAISLGTIVDQPAAETFLRDPNNSLKLLDLTKIGNAQAIEFFNRFGRALPKELVEPYVEAIAAKQSGLSSVGSLKELIEKLPGDRGNSGTIALINEADLAGMCAKKATTFDAEAAALAAHEPHVLRKLANKMSDAVLYSKTESVLRGFWGPKGKDANSPTNFARLLHVIGKLNISYDVLTAAQVHALNDKLYTKKITDNREFIGTRNS